MLEKGKISSKQAIFLIIITIISTAIIFLPTQIYSASKQDSWLSVIFVGFIGIFLAFIIAKLGIMYRDKTIIEYSQIILGQRLGQIIGLIIFLSFFHINIVIIREFAELLVGAFYPDTPKIFFTIAIIAISSYALYQGLEVIARVNEILFPIFFIMVMSIFFFNIPEMNINHLTPVLANGLIPVLNGMYSQTLWYIELIIMTILIPSLNIPTRALKVTFSSIIFVVLFGIIAITAIIAVFGQETANLTFPFLSLGRFINIANFLEQLDSFILFIWVAGVFIKITIFHYCAVLSLSQLLKLKDYQPVILPIGVLLSILAIIFWSDTNQLTFQLHTYINPIYTFGLGGILVLLFLIAYLKNYLAKNKS